MVDLSSDMGLSDVEDARRHSRLKRSVGKKKSHLPHQDALLPATPEHPPGFLSRLEDSLVGDILGGIALIVIVVGLIFILGGLAWL